jgi:hypothetical protein
MEIYTAGRQQGKTTYLIDWVREGIKTDSYPFWDRVILTYSIQEADRLRRKYKLDYNQVYSTIEWTRSHIGPKPVKLAIDNADILLSEMFGRNTVDIATFTQE